MTTPIETLSDLQNFLNQTYGEKNSNQSFEYLYSFASQNCAYLARAVEKKSDPSSYFIGAFSWICALGSHLKIDIQDTFYKKFPDCCPYCLERTCQCLTTNKTSLRFTNQREAEAERRTIHASNIGTRNKKAKDTARTLNSIYPSNRAIWKTHGPHYQFSRLFEELGEIYEAYCSYKINGDEHLHLVGEEIADCLAWLLSAWDIQYPEKSFTDAFSDYYSKDCPACLKNKCECRDHYSRNKSLHSEKDLKLLLESLKKLKIGIQEETSEIPSTKEALEIIEEAANELKSASSSTSPTEVKAILNRNDTLLRKAKNSLMKIPEMTEKVNHLFEIYENIKDNLPWT